jgi:hypothetical protein
LKNIDEPSILQRNGETAFAVSLERSVEGLIIGFVGNTEPALGRSDIPDAVQRVSDAPQSRDRFANADGFVGWAKALFAPCPPSIRRVT